MKDRIKRVIAFLLAVTIFWQVIPADVMETYATPEIRLQLELKDNGAPVEGAIVKAKNTSTNDEVTLSHNGAGKYISETPVVSENGLSYTFHITYNGVYEEINKTCEVVYDQSSSVLKYTYDEMNQHHLYKVSGIVFDYNWKGLSGVQVKAYKGNNNEPDAQVEATNFWGGYEMYLTPGNYVLQYSKNGFATEKKSLTVGGETWADAVSMKEHYELKIKKDVPDSEKNNDVGTIEVKSLSENEIKKENENTYYVLQGDKVQITANPKTGYRLTVGQEAVMNSDTPVGQIDNGSSYSVIFDTLDQDNWPSEYKVSFEVANSVVTKYDGQQIYYCRDAKNASVSTNGENFTVTCADTYYISGVENSNVTTISSNGVKATYQFNANTEQVAYVNIEEDKRDPELKLSVSENNLLLNVKKEGGVYLPNGSENYWYINDDKTLYAQATDTETGMDGVMLKIGNRDSVKMDVIASKDYTVTYSKEVLRSNIEEDSNGSKLSITAYDKAGNDTPMELQVFFDDVAPSVSENISVSSSSAHYYQNGKLYVGADEVDLEAYIKDGFGIRNVYYLVTDQNLTEKQLKTTYENDGFKTTPKNVVTADQQPIIFTANLQEFPSGRLYAYAMADDFALNINPTSIGRADFEKDGNAPKILDLKDVSKHNSIYKRNTDEIKLSAVFEDQETPSGMKYYITKAVKIEPGKAVQQPSATAADATWIPFGDVESSQKKYENVTMSVSHNGTPGSYRVWVYVKDGCNNISEPKSYTFHIDSKEPVMETLDFEVKENNNTVAGWFFKFGNFFRKDASKSKNQLNKNVQTVTIKVKATDKIEPEANYIEEAETGIQSVKLYYVTGEKLKDSDTYMKGIHDERSLPVFEHSSSYKTYDPATGEYTFELEIPEGEVFYRLLAVATDYAGNCAYLIPTSKGKYQSDMVMWDSIVPEIKMTLKDEFKTPDYENGSKKWYSKSKDVAFDVEVKDTGAGLFASKYTVNGKEKQNLIHATNQTEKAKYDETIVLKSSQGPVDKETGKVTVYAHVQDNAGNETELKKTVYIDADRPVIKEVIFEGEYKDDLSAIATQYGYFFRKKTTVTVNVTDFVGKTQNLGSGVKKVTYYLLDCENKMTPEKSISLTKTKDNIYTGKFVIPKGFKGQVYVRAEDNTGQSYGYQSPKGVVIEDAAEHATHSKAEIKLPETSYTDEEGNPLYNHLPTIQYVTKDTKSGILQNVWSVTPFHLGSTEAEGVLDVTSNYNEAKGKFDPVLSGDTDWTVSKKLDLNLVTTANRTYSVKNQMNHIQAELQLTDNAGNKTKKEIKVFSVDTTNPEIEVEYDNNDVQNEKYYKEPRIATITVKERNFSTEGVEMIITGDGAKIGEWQHHAGGGCDGTVHTDECTNVCNVTFDEDEEYTFTINCTDRAGNEGSYGQVDEFVIDLTNPVIQVTYDNNNARNGSYYKEARTATISIEETNFDEERTLPTITAKLQDTPIEAPVVSAFTTVEDMNTATVTYDKDGDYTFNIEVTDLAGNEADIFVPESFTVDMTAPELVVEGVEDGSANKGVVQPIITYTDVNMDEESVDIILTGANLGKVDFGKVETKVENGKKIDLGDFKHEQEVDDLYTLETVIVDMAGNEVTDTRTFSVNRFGSVYVYDDDTKDLMDDFYTNKEKDLVITEINVDTLEFVEIDSSIDGEITTLEEGKDYEVKKAYTDKQWRAYEYHIPATNFEKEGAYVVTIYSEDRAENKSSNKAKGKELNFVVDKTAPTIVVGGIEDGGQYREASREITLDVEDNVLLKTVDVYVNGAIVKTVAQEELLTENGRIKVNLKGSNKKQVLTVQSKDAAGNHAESKAVSFLITPNIFVQWYSNKPIFIGSILVMAGAVGFVFFRRRKITVPPSTTA